MSTTERLSMLDEFGVRKTLIPAEVHGPLRKWRDRVYLVLMVVFLGLPWIQIGGRQAILIDIPGRHFDIFGVSLMAHDAPLLFLLLSVFALLLAFLTSMLGRVWCGWACPQTVFIEGIYRRIERWVEGDYLARRSLRDGAWSFEKLRKNALKWSLYFLISSAFAHSFIAYFSGSKRLLSMMGGSPLENWTYFLLVMACTALMLFNFGWMREQFCIIMCPYGRFQGVLMDQETKTVFYDRARGEPRRGSPKTPGEKSGDCITCNRCVQVCPTGIDIRNGIQMECIACTACIDACNEMMLRIKKPPGLISIRSEEKSRKLSRRPRSLSYLSLALASAAVLLFALVMRKPYALTVLRAQDVPYQELTDKMVLNHFHAHVMNQSHLDEEFIFSLPDSKLGLKLTGTSTSTYLRPGEAAEIHLFLEVPKVDFDIKGQMHTEILLEEQRSGNKQVVPLTLVGPYSGGS